MKRNDIYLSNFTEYKDSDGVWYLKFDDPKPVHIPNLFTLHESIFDETGTLESVDLHHPTINGFKVCGAYRIFNKVTNTTFYFGGCASSFHRGVVDRLVDFRTGVLAGVGQIDKQSSPYQNGLNFGKKYGKLVASNLSAEYFPIGAGESEVIKRESFNKEASLLRNHLAKTGNLPEFNSILESEYPLPLKSEKVPPENSEVFPSSLEQFMNAA